MVYLKVTVLLLISEFSSLPGITQSINTINLAEIHQKQVRKYIVSRSIDQMHDFSSIHASWKKNLDESVFNIIEKTFYLKYKLSDVWGIYRHTDPIKMWNGQSVRFGLLISKCSNTVIYANNSSCPGIDTGQVYFLDLRLIKGLFNIPVAFEIINIDQIKQIVEFSYIDNNIELGKQTLWFFDDGENRTRIVHRSYFKSDSPFRDEFLYPYFHNILIKDFHRNMRQLIKSSQLTGPLVFD